MEMQSRDKVVDRLKQAVRPLLYRTRVADPDQPDGYMRLYLFQHEDPPVEFGSRHRDSMLCSQVAPTPTPRGPCCVRPGDWLGPYAGFHAEGVVYCDDGGLRVIPFSSFTERALVELEQRVARIKPMKAGGLT